MVNIALTDVATSIEKLTNRPNKNSIAIGAPLPAAIEVIDNTDNSFNQILEPATPGQATPHPLPFQEDYSLSEIAALLNENVKFLPWQGLNNRLRNQAEVCHLYAQFNYRPLWTQDGRVTKLADSLIQATKKAWQHGLKPEVYHTAATSSLSVGQTVAEPEKFDIILSDAFITLKQHLTNGIVNPKQQFSTWNQKAEAVDYVSQYQTAAQNNNVNGVLSVDNRDYQHLKKAYVRALKKEKNAQQYPKISANILKFGQRNAAVVALRQRLGLPTNSNVYDKSVRNAVKAYQKNNGLGADGIAGKNTLAHLNGELQSAKKLAINMERLRWQKAIPYGNYIWVNIPAYQMAVRNGNDYKFESNVIVGRESRQTPIFNDTLEYVVLAPYWNVPKTIFKEDKLPKLKKNPHALGKNMQVLSRASGKVVSPASVNWHSGGEGYRLRQLPGPKNSLGRMKFLFPNNHAIYLHDTPTRSLFKKSHRAFSSGCVRVERAEDLALFLLQDRGYDRPRIQAEGRKKKEKWLKLRESKRYPVYLSYYTAWVDKSGKVRYSSDIYGYDEPLMRLYQAALKKL